MNNKRKILKNILGASAVYIATPNSWVKPIINSVLLPSHAQTSVSNQKITFYGELLTPGQYDDYAIYFDGCAYGDVKKIKAVSAKKAFGPSFFTHNGYVRLDSGTPTPDNLNTAIAESYAGNGYLGIRLFAYHLIEPKVGKYEIEVTVSGSCTIDISQKT